MPNAVPASRRAWSSGVVELARRHGTTRMPRPPPPIDALTITGIAELLGERLRFVDRLRPARRCRTGPARSAFWAMSPGGDLVAELFEDLRSRADEDDARPRGRRGRSRVLGQEAVAGMDGVDLVLLGQRDDAGDVEIGADRLAGLADAVGLVGLEAVQGEAVFVRVDGDGADAQLVGRAEDADGDLAAVGDEQFLERRERSVRHVRQDPRRGGGRGCVRDFDALPPSRHLLSRLASSSSCRPSLATELSSREGSAPSA